MPAEPIPGVRSLPEIQRELQLLRALLDSVERELAQVRALLDGQAEAPAATSPAGSAPGLGR